MSGADKADDEPGGYALDYSGTLTAECKQAEPASPVTGSGLTGSALGATDSIAACWHCKAALIVGRPHCEKCPLECDDEDCTEEGCVEARVAPRAPNSSGLTGSLVERLAKHSHSEHLREFDGPTWENLSETERELYREEARAVIALIASETEPPSDTELFQVADEGEDDAPEPALRRVYDYATARANARFEVERAELLSRATELARAGCAETERREAAEKRVAELEAELRVCRLAADGTTDNVKRLFEEKAELMAALEWAARRQPDNRPQKPGLWLYRDSLAIGGEASERDTDGTGPSITEAIIRAHRESGGT